MNKESPMKLEPLNVTNVRIEKLKSIFPEVFTEGGVDFNRLKAALGDMDALSDGRQVYGLTWPGKADAIRNIQIPSHGALLPCPEESINFDESENIFIEGDNLEVLKLLQHSYSEKIKMIYIDPPYNTGNEFIYPDNFHEGLQDYLKYSGQINDEGFKVSTNKETDGRYHSKWLSMMYSRLFLARNLLKEDGVIFISVDDNELANLKEICDEIFHEENFLGIFVVNSSPSAIDYGHVGKVHDYVLFYARNYKETETSQIPEEGKEFKYVDEVSPFNLYPLYNGNVAFNPDTRPNLYYPFYLNPKNKISDDFYEIGLDKKAGWVEVYPVVSRKDGIQRVWRWGKPKSKGELNKEIVGYKTDSGEYRVVQKTRHTGKMIRSIQDDKEVSSRKGTAQIEELFGKKVFTFPKPKELIKRHKLTDLYFSNVRIA